MTTEITPPIELVTAGDVADHFDHQTPRVEQHHLDAIGSICATAVSARETAEASRDWWPLTMHWALRGEVPKAAAIL